jgi:hypothetical protein
MNNQLIRKKKLKSRYGVLATTNAEVGIVTNTVQNAGNSSKRDIFGQAAHYFIQVLQLVFFEVAHFFYLLFHLKKI